MDARALVGVAPAAPAVVGARRTGELASAVAHTTATTLRIPVGTCMMVRPFWRGAVPPGTTFQ